MLPYDLFLVELFAVLVEERDVPLDEFKTYPFERLYTRGLSVYQSADAIMQELYADYEEENDDEYLFD